MSNADEVEKKFVEALNVIIKGVENSLIVPRTNLLVDKVHVAVA